MMEKIRDLFVRPSLAVIAKRELEEAKYSLFEAQKSKQVAEQSIDFYSKRIKVLAQTVEQENV